MVRYNCVNQYIRSVEPKAISVPVEQFSKSIVEWYPTVPAFPDPIQEHLLVRLKNESKLRIIAADIILTNGKAAGSDIYKAYAEYPVEPGTVGTLRVEVITGTSEQATKSFWKKHAWGFGAVYGVPR